MLPCRLIPLVLLLMLPAFATELSLEGYVPRDLDTALLRREYSRIANTVGLKPVDDRNPVNIIFYRISEERKTGIRLPEWGGGGAIGRDSIVIPVDRKSAFYHSETELIILHEMVHIALERGWGRLHIPRWFHEGMAMTLAGELQFEEQVILSRAVVTRTLLSLGDMENLNRFNQWRAQVAYSQCHFAVQFLLDTYGFDLIPELLAQSRSTRRFDRACLLVFGLTVDELDKLLQKEMSARFRLLFLLSDYSLLWLGIVALAVAGFVATGLRNRRRKQRMEQEELEEIDREALASMEGL